MAMVEGLNAVEGDLSDGQAGFRDALTGLTLDAPNGMISLDENRQAIATNFVNEVVQLEDGYLATQNVAVIEGVTQTLGLSADAFAAIGLPSREAPECKASYWSFQALTRQSANTGVFKKRLQLRIVDVLYQSGKLRRLRYPSRAPEIRARDLATGG